MPEFTAVVNRPQDIEDEETDEFFRWIRDDADESGVRFDVLHASQQCLRGRQLW